MRQRGNESTASSLENACFAFNERRDFAAFPAYLRSKQRKSAPDEEVRGAYEETVSENALLGSFIFYKASSSI